ncbi:MAG: hypothetical protein V7739_18655 [Motiliproteus sp.]
MSDRNIDPMLLLCVATTPQPEVIEQQQVVSFLLFGSFLMEEIV